MVKSKQYFLRKIHVFSGIVAVDPETLHSSITGLIHSKLDTVKCLSPGPEDSVKVSSNTVDWNPLTVASDRTLQSFGWSNRGQQITRGLVSTGPSSSRSSHLVVLKDRWQTEAEACQDPSETGV